MKFENENWAQFKGETWKKEINVRDFIQNNYKPYNGDDTFLVPSSEKTKKVWNKRKHSKKCTFYTLRFGCSFAAVNTIKPQLL